MAFRMARAVLKLDEKGIRAFLQSPEVKADIERRTAAIARAAGKDMQPRVYIGFDRARGHVRTNSREADLAEARDRALTRAIEAGR